MKAIVNVQISSVRPEVIIEHKQEELRFSISVFARSNFQGGNDVFNQINKYWQSLSDIEQDTIFLIYKEIQFGFDNVWVKAELSEYLSERVKRLLDIHDLESLYTWVTFKSDIIIPKDFDVDYKHSIDNNTSREKTYTRSDYIRLITLGLCLRCMVPVWGEYIPNIRKETGNLFKEFDSFHLLHKSSILESVPMEKLKLYVDNIVGKDKYDPNNTHKGISSEDFGYWLLASICVRRLCIGEISGLDDSANLMTSVYKFIMQKIQNNNNNNFENIVKEKKFDDNTPDSENKISTLERYKKNTDIAPGEIVELEYSAKDMIGMANRLSCKIEPHRLLRSIETSRVLINERILDPQTTLLRWVFKPIISPKGILYLPKPTIVEALGALEAVLWARGHKYLAILATSRTVILEKEMMVSPLDSKMRIPKEDLAELSRLYPFTKVINNKKLGPKVVNLTADSIDRLTDNLTMFSWKSTADDSMIEEVFGSKSRTFPIKPDIKLDLTRLVIELGNRSWL
jgi:hypothetical protein